MDKTRTTRSEKVRILLYSYNYTPEKTGIGKFNGEWAEWLAARGHDVTVITSNPYYPEWKVSAPFDDKQWSDTGSVRTGPGSIRIMRTPMYIPKKLSGSKRILIDLSFILSSMVSWFKCIFQPRFDLVITICPPTLSGFWGYTFKFLKGSRWLIHVQDLQVDAAVHLGMLKNRLLIKFLTGLEKFFLNKATFVSSISDGMMWNILNKGISKEKYHMIPNWVDTTKIRPLSDEQRREAKRSYGIDPDLKVILYSGNMGEKQGLEIIPELAELFRDRPDVCFILCGEGALKETLKNKVAARNTPRVKFLPLQSLEHFPLLIGMADIHLIPQKKAAGDLVLPSKLTGILSAGGVSVVAAESGTSLHTIILENEIGVIVPPESLYELCNAINDLLSRDLSIYQLNTRRYAVDTLSIEGILGRFEKELLFDKRGHDDSTVSY